LAVTLTVQNQTENKSLIIFLYKILYINLFTLFIVCKALPSMTNLTHIVKTYLGVKLPMHHHIFFTCCETNWL